jgi:hypothetical protein
MTLKDAIKQANKIFISTPRPFTKNGEICDEFLFAVTKKEVREELEEWMDDDMAEMEDAEGVQVNWLWSGSDNMNQPDNLRITFG